MPGPAIHVFYPFSFWGGGPRETCYRICRHWPGQGADVAVHSAACLRPDPAGIMAPALPMWVPGKLRRRLAGQGRVEKYLQNRSMAQGLAAIRPGDLCYLWPGTPLEVQAAIRDRGGRVVLEFINTHSQYAKEILDRECDRVGAPRYEHFGDEHIDYDIARVKGADAVFAPGPLVEASIRDSCPEVPRILPTSYGTDLPDALPPRAPAPDRPVRFLYVGLLSLRKGLHVLLEAWAAAGVPGELWLAGGSAEPWLEQSWLRDLPGSVRMLGHVNNIAEIYAQADVFVFPSLEEGGPQVTYEAAAQGLPLLVTPMGGGFVARPEETALVVPPSDAAALAEALHRLATEPELRQHLGQNAGAAAPHFAWPAVAARRLEQMRALAGHTNE